MNRLTETSNAELLVHMFGDNIRYCTSMHAWYVWGNRKWHEDTEKELYRMAKAVARSYFTSANELDLQDLNRKRFIAHANTSESLRGLQNMIALAQTEEGICVGIDDFDRDQMLLNVENGTIDLSTQKLHKFDRLDYMTKIAPVTYDKNAWSETWDKFLKDVIPDPDVRGFLQTAVGYSLTGQMDEDKMFMLHGRGGNGKTTFVSTILNMLGDYGSQAASNMLMHKKNSGPSNELFVLIDKRFVSATETSESHRLDENLIKQMTGMDRVSINPKYKSQMEFTPTWKIWLSTNHEPVIVGTDIAIWRRLLKIPFNVTITGEQRDPKLKPFLMRDRKERSGILNWALRGVKQWNEEGLVVPQAIIEATRWYRADQDLTGRFIEDCCQLHPNLSISKNKLYKAYSEYCRQINEKEKPMKAFGHQLKEREISDGRIPNSRHWIGIDVRKSVSLNPLDYLP